MSDPGDVDDQQRAEELRQPQIFLTFAAVPRGLQQGGQESQADRDGNEKEMIDRRKRELPPSQINVGHLPLRSGKPIVNLAASASPGILLGG
jgi:hypothetical protein